MEQMKTFLDQTIDALPFVGVAAIGALIQCLKGNWRGWRNLFLSVLSAGFGAFIVGMSAHDMGISNGWSFFISGMIGYSGGSLVDEMLKATTSKLDKVIGKTDRKEDE